MADNLEEDEWWLKSAVNSELDAAGYDVGNRKRDPSQTENDQIIKAKKKKKGKKQKVVEVSLGGRPTTANILWQFFCENMKKRLSTLELEELEFGDACCLQLEQETTGDVSEMNNYLKAVVSKWSERVKSLNEKDEKSSPILLIITSSATRACSINRCIATFKGKCTSAKLFAKHMKIEDQCQFLKSHVVHCGVGTPNRVMKLLKEDSLKLTNLEYLILDWNWRDQKQRSMKDIPEIREDLLKLLQLYLLPLVRSSSCNIGLF